MRGSQKTTFRVMTAVIAGVMLLGVPAAIAQQASTKLAIINIQIAIAQSSDGQQAARDIQAKFSPKQQELTKVQQEIRELQDQLRNQEKTLSEDARNRLLRSIDEKTRAFNRSNEDFNAEFQQAEQDAINEIGQKMMSVIGEYAEKNSFSIILDVSSPQTPVLYAAPATDITRDIIELYNQAHGKPAAATQAPAAPAAAAPAATP